MTITIMLPYPKTISPEKDTIDKHSLPLGSPSIIIMILFLYLAHATGANDNGHICIVTSILQLFAIYKYRLSLFIKQRKFDIEIICNGIVQVFLVKQLTVKPKKRRPWWLGQITLIALQKFMATRSYIARGGGREGGGEADLASENWVN